MGGNSSICTTHIDEDYKKKHGGEAINNQQSTTAMHTDTETGCAGCRWDESTKYDGVDGTLAA